jgi:hypothetical protein
MRTATGIRLALVGAKDICEIMECCLRTVDYWSAQKKLPPAYWVRGKRMWLAKDLEAFIRSRNWYTRTRSTVSAQQLQRSH